jgi:hypothetical protein
MSGVIPKTQVCRRVELNDEDNASMHTTTLHHRGEYKIHVERVVSHDPPAVAGATWIKVIFLKFHSDAKVDTCAGGSGLRFYLIARFDAVLPVPSTIL